MSHGFDDALYTSAGVQGITPGATVTRTHRKVGLLQGLTLGWRFDGPRAAGRRATGSGALWDPDTAARARQEVAAAWACIAGVLVTGCIIAALLPVAALPWLMGALPILLTRRRMAAMDAPVALREAIAELGDWVRSPGLGVLFGLTLLAAVVATFAPANLLTLDVLDIRSVDDAVAVAVSAWPVVPAAVGLLASLSLTLAMATVSRSVRQAKRDLALTAELGPALRGALGLPPSAPLVITGDGVEAHVDLSEHAQVVTREQPATAASIDAALAAAVPEWSAEELSFPWLTLRPARVEDQERREVAVAWDGLVVAQTDAPERLPETLPTAV